MKFTDEDKIIVTGASSGIGKSIALKLNEQGATVIAIGRSIERLQQAKNEAKNQNNFHIEPKDLLEDIENLPNYIKLLKEKYGKFKALACVAGIDKITTTATISKNDIDEVFTINYTVPMLLTKGFVDRRNNVGEGANILFIASISGVYPDKGQIIYGASKAALIAATTAISKEIAPRKMRCNCISPAWIETPMFTNQKDTIGVSVEQYALGVGQPEDVSQLAAFLMSSEARWITAENYYMRGGVTNGKYV